MHLTKFMTWGRSSRRGKRKPKKVIFLDIDGVICTLRSHFAFAHPGGLMKDWDVTACQMLAQMCRKHNIKIVVSSTWRTHEDLSNYMCVYGLIDHVHPTDPVTKRFPPIKNKVTKNFRNRIRGFDVSEWLRRHPEVTDYCIIDDDRDFYKYQMRRLIHVTSNSDGLSAQNWMDMYEWFGRKRRKHGKVKVSR